MLKKQKKKDVKMIKYQVFLSSVSSELQEERNTVISGLIESNQYFPIAMEYFQASDSTVRLLYKYLTDADIYVLIIKDSIGSEIGDKNAQLIEQMGKEDSKLEAEVREFCKNTGRTVSQITFTQLEYIYAKAMDLKILAFVYRENEKVKLNERIKNFCGSAFDHTAKGWEDAPKLRERILKSLDNLVSDGANEDLGWIRRKTDPMLIRFREAGIVDLVKNGEENVKLEEKLQEAEELDLFFTTGKNFANANIKMLAEFVARGGVVKLLCGYPRTEFLSNVADVECFKLGDRSNIHDEYKLVVESLVQTYHMAKTEWEKNSSGPLGKILIGDSETLFRSTILITKQKNHEMWGWIKLTLPPEKSVDMISLELEQKETEKHDDLLSSVVDHFNSVWKLAESRKRVICIGEHTKADDIRKTEADSNCSLNNKEYWEEKYKEAVRKTRKRKGNRILIEVAAQHPLRDNLYPDVEFKARLNFAIQLLKEQQEKGNEIEIYVPGSVHLDFEGIEDEVSLSEAGCNYLEEKGVSPEILHGEDLNTRYDGERNWAGVYNSADECYVASKFFEEKEFDQLICICSPNQVTRKTFLYINQGIVPLVYSVPVRNMFHKPVNEIYNSIPYLLEQDYDWQGVDSSEAIRTRTERMPGFKK